MAPWLQNLSERAWLWLFNQSATVVVLCAILGVVAYSWRVDVPRWSESIERRVDALILRIERQALDQREFFSTQMESQRSHDKEQREATRAVVGDLVDAIRDIERNGVK